MRSWKVYRLGLWLGVIVGIGLLIWSIFALGDYNNKLANGVTVQATIERVDSITYKRGHPSTYGTAVYEDEKGGLHRFEGYLGDYVDVGDHLSVIYEKDHPDSVVRENPAMNWLPWIAGALIVFSGGLLLLVALFRKDKKSVKCMQQAVSAEELARVVREYMPQTKQKFITERKKNKHFDKLGCDAVLQQMLDSGDPVKQIYDHYQEILSSDDIRLSAVVRATDRDIYSPAKDFGSEEVENGRARMTVPVLMIYGEDSYFNDHPAELKMIAERLSGQQYGMVLNPQDSELVAFLSDNRSRPFGIRYCSELTMNRPIVLSTVILSKPALCNQKLCNRLLYVAVSGQYAAVLPAWYYSLWELSAF